MKLEQLKAKLVKWLANKFGYKIIMLKAANGVIAIEGDKEVLKYVDTVGYFFNKEPLSRYKPKAQVLGKDEKLKQVTLDNLKELGIEVEPFTEEELKETV